MPNTKSLLALALAIASLVFGLAAQPAQVAQNLHQCPIEGRSPTEVVDEVWRLATQGELLTLEGWQRTDGFFTKPTPFPGNKLILVMSNNWGQASVAKSDAQRPEVSLGYWELGKIDSTLHFLPAPKTEFIKTAFLYRLVAVPAYIAMYGSDGKTLLNKKPTGSCVWQIEGELGTEWATVNAAIRYVLEAGDRTRNEATKKAADQTLRKLKLYH
jgi:hypothetical protein